MEQLAKAYNEFQSNYGQSVSLDYVSIVNNLFDINFTKIANGTELVKGRENLLPQLKSLQKISGCWHLEIKEVIPSKCNKKCTINYCLKSEKAGAFEIMAILRSSDGRKIDAIDEVYYQV